MEAGISNRMSQAIIHEATDGWYAALYAMEELTSNDPALIPINKTTEPKQTKQPKTKSTYKLIKLESKTDCIKHTKHSGWCTGKTDNDHYEDTYQYGELWCIYKPKRRRPSYQLYISPYNLIEFSKSGNHEVNIWQEIERDEELKKLIEHLLPRKEHLQLKARMPNFTEQLRNLNDELGRLSGSVQGASEALNQLLRNLHSNLIPGRTITSGYHCEFLSDLITGEPINDQEKKWSSHRSTALDRLNQRNNALEAKKELFQKMKMTLFSTPSVPNRTDQPTG